MDVATVDLWATSGRSYLHRASPAAKLIAAALLLAGVILVLNVLVVATVFVLVLAVARRSGIPVGRFTLAALYPGIFALLFALAQFHGDFFIPATTIAKAVTAASVVVLLIATTPYPRLFAALRPVLPDTIVEVLYVTYRSVFILLRVLGDAFTSVRLRGGSAGAGLRARLRNVAAALAVGAVYSFDVSERTYAVMRLRGYSGRISGEQAGGLRPADLPLVTGAVLVAALVVLFRCEWRALNPFSWMPLAAAITIFAVALVLPRRASPAGQRPVTEIVRGDAE